MSNAKQTILLVGGAGYIGSHLSGYLSPQYEVVITSRKKSSQLNHIEIDFLEEKTFSNLLGYSFDCILLLAASLKGMGTMELKEEYLEENIRGVSNFLHFLQVNKIASKLVYVSSMTVYGKENLVPVKETGVLLPLSTYGFTKKIGEELVEFYAQGSAANVVSLRIPGVYGGMRKAGLVYNTAQRCKQGETIQLDTSTLGYWETIHIDDLCAWVVSFLEKYAWEKKYEVFNMGYGVPTDIVACVHHIKRLLNSSSPIEVKGKEGYQEFYLDTERINSVIKTEDRYLKSLENYLKTV